MAEEPSLPYYLPIAGGRIIGFIPFPRVLVLCEKQSVFSRIWTRVAVSISYADNHYTNANGPVNVGVYARAICKFQFKITGKKFLRTLIWCRYFSTVVNWSYI